MQTDGGRPQVPPQPPLYLKSKASGGYRCRQRAPSRPRIDGQPQRVWNNTYFRQKIIPFKGNKMITLPMPKYVEVIDYFKVYITDTVINQIWRETNRYAQQYIYANAASLRPPSIVNKCKPTNANEIKAFPGLCIIMKIIYKPRGWMHWFTDCLQLNCFQPGYYQKEVPKQNFLTSRTMKIHNITQMMLKGYRLINTTVYYTPEHITVDKSLVFRKGHC